MIGAGTVSAMISSLKNNARPKKAAFSGWKRETVYYKGIVTNRNASAEELKKLRNKIRKENRKAFLRIALGTLFVIAALLILLFAILENTVITWRITQLVLLKDLLA